MEITNIEYGWQVAERSDLQALPVVGREEASSGPVATLVGVAGCSGTGDTGGQTLAVGSASCCVLWQEDES